MRVKEIFDEVIFDGEMYKGNDVVKEMTIKGYKNKSFGYFFCDYVFDKPIKTIDSSVGTVTEDNKKNEDEKSEVETILLKRGRKKNRNIDEGVENLESVINVKAEEKIEKKEDKEETLDETDKIKKLAKFLGKRKNK